MKHKQKIQTKRNPRNSYNWETKVNHEVRKLNRARYFKLVNKKAYR